MTMGPIIRTGPEITKVGMETEVKITFRTWLVCIFVSAVDVLSVVSILVLSSLQVWNWQHPPRIHGSGWWPPVARALVIWWPSAVILMLVGVIAWSVPLLYRFLAETVVKQFPQYTQYPSELGRWRPFVRPPATEEYEAEAKETETVDVNLTTQAKGRKRPQIRVIEGMPTDRRSKEFYRAVVNNVYPFSESGAGNCRVSQRGFRKIRDALMARGLADWKDAARHKSGVDLNDGAFGLMSALSSRR